MRIINCARGGLIDEEALCDALEVRPCGGRGARRVRGGAGDQPHRCSASTNVVCTPHLGASTAEAQENVALQVAEQMADYLLTGAVSNALNMPSISAEEAPRLKPFIALAEKLGSFAGQLTDEPVTGIVIEYAGDVGEMNTRALTSAALAGVLQPHARHGEHGVGARGGARARHQGGRGQADAARALTRPTSASR